MSPLDFWALLCIKVASNQKYLIISQILENISQPSEELREANPEEVIQPDFEDG